MSLQTSAAPDPGIYGPGSVTWRVHADPSMALSGLRALLLQALHPLAMSGVAQHSDFREDPWGRLFRTADYVGVTTYGTTEQARRAGAKVRGIHRKLAGIEPESGTTYRVDDPDLLRWVHCVEVESFLSTAVRCGLRLSAQEQDAYYAEQTVGATLVGLDPTTVPASVDQMAAYFRDVRPQLRMTAAARDAAAFVLWPPMPSKVAIGTPARPAWVALAAAAAATLPRWARRMYRLPGLPTTDLAATAAGAALRAGLLVVPTALREGPHRKDARERLGLTPLRKPLAAARTAVPGSRTVIERPATRDDLRAVVELFCAYDLAFRGGVDTDDSDLTDDWDGDGFDWAAATLVLEDAGRVVGYATVVEEYADAMTTQDRAELLGPLLDWVEQHTGQLEHYVPDTDAARHALMASRGWVAERRFWRMRRELDAPSPEPVWPEGVTVRAYDRPGDDVGVHALIQTSFREIGGQHDRGFAEWRGYLLETEKYDADLYLVAESGGEVVGAALSQVMGTDYGFVRQLAVARSQRGRGVGLALLHECFRRHGARGLPATVLGVDAGNRTGALGLYEKAGMRVVEQFTRWDRPALDRPPGSGR